MSYSFIAVKFGKLHYRDLERNKVKALAQNKGNFDAYTSFTYKSIQNIWWWLTNINKVYEDIYKGSPSATLTTDASLKGWGAVSENESICYSCLNIK